MWVHLFFEELVELDPRGIGASHSNRPDHREEEERFKNALEVIHLFIGEVLLALLLRNRVEVAFQQFADGVHQVIIACLYDLLGVLAVEVEGLGQVLAEEFLYGLVESDLVHQFSGQTVEPALEVRLIAQGRRFHVDHSTTGHCGRGGLGQVSHLEYHGHVLGEGDDLATVQTEFLVIVQDSVHTLDP